MTNLFKAIFCLTLFIFVKSNSHLNTKYHEFLAGEQQFSLLLVSQIYSEFNSPFHERSTYRFNLFAEKVNNIRKHNKNKGIHGWMKGVNDFSDMTFAQVKQSRLMKPQQCSATNRYRVADINKQLQIKQAFQWNDYNVVTPVKDQGDCGSCWTFSTVGTLQSHWNILQKDRNMLFSQQQLVDCAGDFDNNGCDGGLPSHAFEYIKYAGGIESEVTYPYYAKDMQCAFRRELAEGYVKFGSFNITQGDQSQLAERLYSVGPMAVSFEVTDDFMDYMSGVYKQDGCGTTTQDVNHAVVATGYGTLNGQPFWNVKNSWGTGWGQMGYFKIQRGTNMCAISQCNSYPLIDNIRGLELVD